MKKHLSLFLCGAALTACTLLGAGTAFAHSMPYEETTLILDDFVNGGESELVPRESTLDDAMGAIVRANLGHDHQETDVTSDGFRFVTAMSHYARPYDFRSVTDAQDRCDTRALPITGYDLMGEKIRTSSGLYVGMPYEDVVDQYDEASSVDTNEAGRTLYTYAFDEDAAELTFEVDDAGIIQAIHCRTEI